MLMLTILLHAASKKSCNAIISAGIYASSILHSPCARHARVGDFPIRANNSDLLVWLANVFDSHVCWPFCRIFYGKIAGETGSTDQE